jgi:hypothetical protein
MRKENRAREQAQTQLESIKELLEELQKAEDEEDEEKAEGLRNAIEETPLEVSIREDWHAPGQKADSKEYIILLCTGGPAVRIHGELNEYNEPETAKIEYQDWFTEWQTLDADEDILLQFASYFYFGE